MSGIRIAVACALLSLAGAAAAQTRAPTGAETLQPETDENLEWAASVVQVNYLPNQGQMTVKLFGTAGGDPAMNGLYTYIAFIGSPADGWRVFSLGDVLDYRILSTAPGRVVLQLHESTLDDATGNIGSRTRRVRVRWTPGPDGAPPASVIIGPAR